MLNIFRHCYRKPWYVVFGIVPTTIILLVPLLIFAAQPSKVPQDLLSVTFATDNDGWACGRWGTILHTTDGGKTWNSQTSGIDYTLTGIHFVDPKQGWAVGDQGTIIHTKDGGTIWTKQKSPVPYFLMGVLFVNSKKGWIVTERTTILATEDGGATWQVQFKDEDFILRSLSFCDEQNGWAVGEYGFTYHTDNGGKTWQHQAGEYALSIETMEMKGGNFLFNVVALSPKTAWVAGIDGYVARTEDGGKTWIPVTAGVPKQHLFGIASDKQGNVFIGGDALLLRKADGTNSFSGVKVEPPITYGWFYRIVPRGKSGFVAVGKGGWIYVSDPKGTSWQKVTY
jgi:photosystem II stability/assembly factor-like uncharacterized protein